MATNELLQEVIETYLRHFREPKYLTEHANEKSINCYLRAYLQPQGKHVMHLNWAPLSVTASCHTRHLRYFTFSIPVFDERFGNAYLVEDSRLAGKKKGESFNFARSLSEY